MPFHSVVRAEIAANVAQEAYGVLMPRVNGEVLRWAREGAGLSLEEAAHRLGISGEGAAERLGEMEAGRRDPSRTQLLNMADKYRRPLLTFYLREPPKPARGTPDFRHLPNPERGSEAILKALVRDVTARQQLVRGALEDTDSAEPLPFVGSLRLSMAVEEAVARLEELVGMTREEFRRQRTVDDAFKLLRDATERAGVFVLLMGNLGNYHTDLDPAVFRGFVIADPVAPLIVINEKDARSAWSFTLLHELTHVGLGETGISGYGGEARTERFCDAVSAQFLLAPDELRMLDVDAADDVGRCADQISGFAAARKLSRKMVAYNLLRQGKIPLELYQRLCDRFDQERVEQKRAREARPVDYYVVRRHRLGPGLLKLVNRLVADGVLSSTKAGRVLGVKPTAVGQLVTDRIGS